MSGYRRLTTVGMGRGAADIWRAVVAGAPWSRDEPATVGEVLQVYDRSAYLRIDERDTPSLSLPGPRLVLLAGEPFDGPLTMRLASADPGGFEPDTIGTGEACRIRPARRGEPSSTDYVLSVGQALEVGFDLESPNPEGPRATPKTGVSIRRDDAAWTAAASTLSTLVDDGIEDGLGWGPRIQRRMRGGEATRVDRYATDWCDAVSKGWPEGPPRAIREVIGRGPGATPSGDDLLSGTLLLLLHVTEGQTHERVSEAGTMLASLAADQTTSISAALLAQAAKGRAADAVWAAIQAHTNPDIDEGALTSSVEGIVDVGHSSGVDTLLGILIGILLVAPDSSSG